MRRRRKETFANHHHQEAYGKIPVRRMKHRRSSSRNSHHLQRSLLPNRATRPLQPITSHLLSLLFLGSPKLSPDSQRHLQQLRCPPHRRLPLTPMFQFHLPVELHTLTALVLDRFHPLPREVILLDTMAIIITAIPDVDNRGLPLRKKRRRRIIRRSLEKSVYDRRICMNSCVGERCCRIV